MRIEISRKMIYGIAYEVDFRSLISFGCISNWEIVVTCVIHKSPKATIDIAVHISSTNGQRVRISCKDHFCIGLYDSIGQSKSSGIVL